MGPSAVLLHRSLLFVVAGALGGGGCILLCQWVAFSDAPHALRGMAGHYAHIVKTMSLWMSPTF